VRERISAWFLCRRPAPTKTTACGICDISYRVAMSIPGSELSEDDITIVMDQAHVARPLAVQALKKQG
jgi:hypothetical protein